MRALDAAREVCDACGMRLVASSRPLVAFASSVLACADPGPGDASEGASEASAGSTSTSTGEAGSSSGGVTEGGSGTTGAPQSVSTEVIRYTQQPMVVDVVVTTGGPAGSVTLVHPDDPGAVIEAIAEEGTATTFRIRGLAPDTLHTLTWGVDGLAGPVEFITYPPLLGFEASFAVEGGPVDPAVPYRMFDLIPFPAFDTAGVFMVDGQGRTRFYLGGPSDGIAGPEGIWTAVRLRPDGTLSYLFAHTMWIRDELGAPVVELPDDALGVTGLHHELIELPGGNFMALSHSFQDVDYGQDGVRAVAGDKIVEFTPAGEVVWTWDTFDHLDPHRMRESFEAAVLLHPVTQQPTYDWTHGNALVYDAEADTVLLSLRHQDWILAIDHATGELLWKLGADGDFALVGEGSFFHHQHAPEWQADGSLLLYDNGLGDPDVAPDAVHSKARRFALDLGAMTAEPVWSDDGEPILVPFAGNADRLPGGRILVTDSSIVGDAGYWARLRELDAEASPRVQWSLRTPDQRFAYRGSAHERLIGQAAKE